MALPAWIRGRMLRYSPHAARASQDPTCGDIHITGTPPISSCPQPPSPAPSPFTMTSISHLPLELVIKILCYLDWRDALSCTQVCRLFNTIVNESVELQYNFELAAAGMEDGPPSILSIADRLHCLRRREAAWNRLQWTSDQTMPMHSGGVWELYGGVLAQARSRYELCFTRLPSQIRGIEQKDWEIYLPMLVRDFGMEPSLDLLVVVEQGSVFGNYRIHLLQLSTGKPHHDAPNPALLHHQTAGANYSFVIQISREYLAIMFISSDDNDSYLVVWNWKTGEIEMSLRGLEIGSFGFLTERHILLAVVDNPLIDPPPEHTEPSLLVVDFLKAPNQPMAVLDVTFECAFHYPVMFPWASALAISVRSDPSPMWTPHSDPRVPFHTAQRDRLFVITLWVAEGANISTLMLFVPSFTILDKLNSLAPGISGRRFEWTEWGPSGTQMRFAPRGHSMVWVCYVFGMSFVAPYRPGLPHAADQPTGATRIQVFDFNQLAIKRQLAQGGKFMEDEDEDEVTRIITEPSTVTLNRIFTRQIVTSLPYRWRMKEVSETQTFDSAMLSEDSIVTVSSGPDTRKYRVLSF